MLDPRRIGLDAESVGFLKRTKQSVDWTAFNHALQTDYNNQNSCVQVRRERETPISEIHVMGGERNGLASNQLLLTLARQQRQINGYPLRHFSADNPAVVLPKKYGGFPLYNRNQVAYPELVSVFTEPMSAPLQSNTELLSRHGTVAINPHSLHTPYENGYFVNPLTTDYDGLSANVSQFKQRKHLQNMSSLAGKNKKRKGDGIFINSSGQPMSTVQDGMESAALTMGAFAQASSAYSHRSRTLQEHNTEIGSGSSMSRDSLDSSYRAGSGSGSSISSDSLMGSRSGRAALRYESSGAGSSSMGDLATVTSALRTPPRPSPSVVVSNERGSSQSTIISELEHITEEGVAFITPEHGAQAVAGSLSRHTNAIESIKSKVRAFAASPVGMVLSRTLPESVFIPTMVNTPLQPSALTPDIEGIRAMKNAQSRALGHQRPNGVINEELYNNTTALRGARRSKRNSRFFKAKDRKRPYSPSRVFEVPEGLLF